MPFAYYRKLSPRQKRIYDRSDEVTSVAVPVPGRFAPLVENLRRALESGRRRETEGQSQTLVSSLCDAWRVARVKTKVLEKRPAHHWGELHGLYEPAAAGSYPVLTVWMRTAKRIQVVAFKTFFRTLLHELNHHLDYTLLKLEDSFHTEGFYSRESSLLKQLID